MSGVTGDGEDRAIWPAPPRDLERILDVVLLTVSGMEGNQALTLVSGSDLSEQEVTAVIAELWRLCVYLVGAVSHARGTAPGALVAELLEGARNRPDATDGTDPSERRP